MFCNNSSDLLLEHFAVLFNHLGGKIKKKKQNDEAGVAPCICRVVRDQHADDFSLIKAEHEHVQSVQVRLLFFFFSLLLLLLLLRQCCRGAVMPRHDSEEDDGQRHG